jgi:saccharopine dehydrogenase-like NADP-dependent oxidoreductase
MNIAVFGAPGHTGRFVVAELLRRGHSPIAIGRDYSKLAAFSDARVEARVASLDDSASLARALSGTQVVINCAGPFLDTASPLIEAAIAAGVHYIDVTAEQESVRASIDSFDAAAREQGVVVLPAAGFFGGLGDLLATAAMGDWARADRIDIAIGLDRWFPTAGTRITGTRNTFPRRVLTNGALEPLQPSAPRTWTFPEAFGSQDVVEVPFSETILIANHLDVSEIHNYMNQAPLRDVRDPATPAPVAADERGRSNQTFVVDVVVHNGSEQRRASVQGRDIYAVTAPIVVEAAERICEGNVRSGAFALGDVVDAAAFLTALSVHLS